MTQEGNAAALEQLKTDLVRVTRTCRGPVFTLDVRIRKAAQQLAALKAEQEKDPTEHRAALIEQKEVLLSALAKDPVWAVWLARVTEHIQELESAVDDAAPEERGAITARIAALRTQRRLIRREHRDAGSDVPVACGADVNQLIIAEPLDGEDHEAHCPECGSLIQWTAPSVAVAEEDD